MSRLIGAAPKDEIDHADCDGLNNRRANIRKCTRSQNVANTRRRSDNKSGFKGVFWEARAEKWRAEIRQEGRAKYLGLFETREDAAAAYQSAAIELNGSFARME